MKKTHIVIAGIIILLLFLGWNYKNIMNFYYNNSGEYNKTTNIEGKYNTLVQQGNTSYSGTTASGVNLEKQISLLQNSITSYSGALSLIDNPYIQKNMEFVSEKLKVLQEQLKKDGEKKKEQNKAGEKNGNKQQTQEGKKKQGGQNGKQEEDASKSSPHSSPKGEEKTQEKKGEEGKEKQLGENGETGEQNKQGKKGEKGGTGENLKSGEQKGLSEKTKKILEQKAQELQKQQGEIGKFYNKNYKEKNNSPFDNLADIFGRSIFDNGLLDDTGEKDW